MIIAVFYGGRSCEHDISVITAVQAMACLDEKYEVMPVYMKEGAYYTSESLKDISFYEKTNIKKCQRLWLIDGVFYTRIKNIYIKKFKPDVALICCHGGEGENGSLQGLLESQRIPYTSSGVTACGIAMDKVIGKTLCDGLMLNTVDSITVYRDDFIRRKDEIFRHIETYLDYPLMIKPSALGSSIGISRAKNREELRNAIEIACAFDRKILVERALTDFTELNCAVVSDDENIIVSEIERPLSWSDFLTFDDKYLEGGKGMSGEKRQLPAKIPEDISENVKDVAKRLYIDADMNGVVRIDFLLSKENKLYVNEINSVPGSLAFYLFEPLGISFSALLDMIIHGAVKKSAENKKSRLAFNSSVLKNFGGAKGKQLPKCR